MKIVLRFLAPYLFSQLNEFLTMIYYPKFANGSKWKWEWGGGTQVGDVVVDNVGNRALIFNAKSPHRALPVSDECTLLRSVIVFKMLEKNNGI